MDYAFKLTEISKFKFLNKDYNGLDEIEKQEYLVERFEELAVREENVKATQLEMKNVAEEERSYEEVHQKKISQPKQSKITSFSKKN